MDTDRQEVTRTVEQTDGNNSSTQRVVTERNQTGSAMDIVKNIVSFLVGALEILLGIRFILSLLGANRGNTFADLIYSLSTPFTAPFRGLFNAQTVYGTARFEYEVLIAMLIYALLGWLVIWLLSLNRADTSN